MREDPAALESWDKVNGSVIILRKEEMVRRSVKAFEVFNVSKGESLQAFLK